MYSIACDRWRKAHLHLEFLEHLLEVQVNQKVVSGLNKDQILLETEVLRKKIVDQRKTVALWHELASKPAVPEVPDVVNDYVETLLVTVKERQVIRELEHSAMYLTQKCHDMLDDIGELLARPSEKTPPETLTVRLTEMYIYLSEYKIRLRKIEDEILEIQNRILDRKLKYAKEAHVSSI